MCTHSSFFRLSLSLWYRLLKLEGAKINLITQTYSFPILRLPQTSHLIWSIYPYSRSGEKQNKNSLNHSSFFSLFWFKQSVSSVVSTWATGFWPLPRQSLLLNCHYSSLGLAIASQLVSLIPFPFVSTNIGLMVMARVVIWKLVFILIKVVCTHT